MALNILLPNNKKFYNKNDVPDYDLYSYDAINNSKQLVELLSKNGYKYIQMRQSMFNLKTFKIFVENIPLCDITEISLDTYNIYFKSSKTFNNLKVLNSDILIMYMVMELSQPKLSYYRWEKVHKRYNIFNNIFGYNKLEINNNKIINIDNKYKDILNDLLNICKINKFPLIGSIAINILNDFDYFKSYNKYLSYISVICIDYKPILKYFTNILDVKIIENNKSIIISLNNIDLINIIHANNICISFCTFKEYTIGTLYTISYYLYNYIIDYEQTNTFINNKTDIIKSVKYLIFLNNKLIKKTKINDKCLLSLECYGKGQLTPWQIRKSKWDIPAIKYRPIKLNINIKTPINK